MNITGSFNFLRIYNKLDRKFKLPIFFVVFILDFIYHSIVSLFITLYDPTILESFEEGTSLIEIFLLSVLIGPLVETFLFQYLIIEILYAFKKIKLEVILIVSALAFSLIHTYNFIYIIVTFTSGLIYASYYLYLKKFKRRFPFIQVWALHTLYNLIVFILDDVLNF
ncbi:CPBP family intramembrane metalloprotease [Psychroflexus sp. CAK1W]|uniref:CPBP family glutamic-type intramembrane protease n=1 Tax=Psychroflexus curvus TaxID=2873595 RepID=UPI001CC9192F|nr:CPBP family glutamic-type intramembrane protease [Psychroflexus curvus]MBZ9627138.1 CPBP family intramembrane metalloprotease [Psychroflexus curvus]